MLSTGFHRPSHPPPALAPASSHIPCQTVGVKLTLDFGRLTRPWRAPSCEGLGLVGIVVVGAISLEWAGKAEDDSSYQGEQGGNNAQVKSLSDLKFHAVRYQWGVEVPQDPMKIPGNRDEAQEASKDEEDSTHHRQSVLSSGVLAEDRASHAHHGDNAGQRRDGAGCHHHGLGRLDVSGQAEEGAVDVTLGDACAVCGTLHPEALGEADSRHDAGADVGARSPAGKQHGHQGAQQPQEAQDVAYELEAKRGHGSPLSSSVFKACSLAFRLWFLLLGSWPLILHFRVSLPGRFLSSLQVSVGGHKQAQEGI